MVYVAARQLGCSPNTVKARLEKSERLRRVRDSEHELFLDTAELKLMQRVQEGDLGAIKYTLSTQGKERGYVERSEIKQDVTVMDRSDVPTTADEIRKVEQHIRELDRDIARDPRG